MTLLISILTGLGVGSGGLYILFLTLINNVPQREAQGMNFAFFVTASLSAAVINLIKKRVSLPSLMLLIPSGIAGSLLGAAVSGIIQPRLLSNCFGILLTAIGIIGFFTSTRN